MKSTSGWLPSIRVSKLDPVRQLEITISKRGWPATPPHLAGVLALRVNVFLHRLVAREVSPSARSLASRRPNPVMLLIIDFTGECPCGLWLCGLCAWGS